MTSRHLDLRDHHMHWLRDRALHGVLMSALRAQAARTMAARSRALASQSRRSTWAGQAVRAEVGSAARRTLRLVKS